MATSGIGRLAGARLAAAGLALAAGCLGRLAGARWAVAGLLAAGGLAGAQEDALPEYRMPPQQQEALQFPGPVEELQQEAGPAEYWAVQGQEDAAVPARQLQLLQREIMDLRGQMEELRYNLERLKNLQDQRYLDIDRRLQARGGQAPPARPFDLSTQAGESETPPATSSLDESLDEQALYDSALQLIRVRQYQPAIGRLQELIERFPDGELIANAYYWLGEVHVAKPQPDYEQARQALVQVITYYPDHRKTADAGFKLGKIYHQLGDCPRAVSILKQVVTQFGDQTVARLAEDYLLGLDCDS